MGIDGLYKFINKNIPGVYFNIGIDDIKGQACIIDGMQHIYSQLIYMRSKDNEIINGKGNNVSHIHGLISSLIYYLKNGIIPIFIFDGKAPEIKKNKIEERRKNLKDNLEKLKTLEDEKNKLIDIINNNINNDIIKNNLNDKNIVNTIDKEKNKDITGSTIEDEFLILEPTIESEQTDLTELTELTDILTDLTNQITTDENFNLEEELKKISTIENEYKKIYKKSIVLKDYYIKDWIMILEHLGLPVVKAKNEADPLCAYILKNNMDITGIISNDSDMLIFGAPVLMRKKQNQQFSIIELSILLEKIKILLNNIFNKFIDFTLDNLVDFAILLGTDYGTFKLNKNLNDSLDILKYYISSDKNINNIISPEQIDNFILIKKYYTDFNFDESLSYLLEKPVWNKPKLLALKLKLLEFDVDEDYIDKHLHIINNFYSKYIKKNNKKNFYLNFLRKNK